MGIGITEAFRALMGLSLLTLGRKLFWIFVAVTGFVVGLNLMARFFPGVSQEMRLSLAIVAGLVGGVLAVMLQRAIVWVGGFLIGGYLVLAVLDRIELSTQGWALIAFLLGGLVGALVIGIAFDWALIGLSSLMGALLIAEALKLTPPLEPVVVVVLFLAGVVVQARLTREERMTPRVPDKF